MLTRRELLGAACAVLPAMAKKPSTPSMGLEVYSLRTEAEKDLPATLALIRKMGFHEVEVSALYGHSAPEFRKMLDGNGLKATSMMADYSKLDGQIAAVAKDAEALGVEYVVCSTIPHKKRLTPEECQRAIGDFGRWGKNLAAAGLHLCYHTHGVEFNKSAEGTLFDTLVQRTDGQWVNFEMDIFWIVYAFQDPVAMLMRYPGRFPLMHVKDIRKGTVLGGSPGDVLEEESVPIGAGIVKVPEVLRAAQRSGVKHYYIEDEAVNAAEQIPVSLRYLKTLERY